jgi:hypothetical protein
MSALHQLQFKWNSINPLDKKYFLCGFASVFASFLLVMLLVLFHQDAKLSQLVTQMDSKISAVVAEQINSIRSQLDRLAATQDNAKVGKLSHELTEIEKDVTGVAKSVELQKIAADMAIHLDDLEKIVVSSNHVKQYLEAKVLPFQVISIDVISQQPFVSVDYEHHVMPLGVGDSLAGWKIVSADYAAVEVELKNNQGQDVKVNALGKIASTEEK